MNISDLKLLTCRLSVNRVLNIILSFVILLFKLHVKILISSRRFNVNDNIQTNLSYFDQTTINNHQKPQPEIYLTINNEYCLQYDYYFVSISRFTWIYQ